MEERRKDRLSRQGLTLLVVASLSLVACGSPTPAAADASVLTSDAAETYSSADVQAALAQCALAHGPAVLPHTYRDKRALMVGAWIDCLSSDKTVYAPGLAFAPDGTWRRYLSDGNGGFTLGWGAKNQGTYSFPDSDDHPTEDNPYVVVSSVDLDFTPAGFGDGAFTLETSPNRILATIDYPEQTIEVWLVRLGGA